MRKIIFLFILMLTIFGQAEAKVPYKLKNGEIINAVLLNLNFEHLERTTDNQSLEYRIFANGHFIGYIRWGSILYFKNDYEPVDFYTDGTISPPSNELYFKQADCQGDFYAFLYYDRPDIFHLPQALGRIVTYQGNLYYYKNGETDVYKITPVSKYHMGSCENITNPPSGHYLKFKPNNPAETGIPAYPLPLPLTIEGNPTLNIITE